MQACVKGNSILSEEEIDALKRELKEDGLQFDVTSEQLCYITTSICTVTWIEDDFRQNLLCLPVGSIDTLLWLGLGFEVLGVFVEINPLVLLLFGAHPICTVTLKTPNDFIFQNAKVVRGPSPSCEAQESFTLVMF